MKWIFALNAASIEDYGDFARVAALSARAFNSLEAFCLFDGEPCDFTRELERMDVQIVRVRSRFYEQLSNLAAQHNNTLLVKVASGAFLRLEIPRLARELGWKDEFVFYTDCDVIFQNDPAPFVETLKAHYFAAAARNFYK